MQQSILMSKHNNNNNRKVTGMMFQSTMILGLLVCTLEALSISRIGEGHYHYRSSAARCTTQSRTCLQYRDDITMMIDEQSQQSSSSSRLSLSSSSSSTTSWLRSRFTHHPQSMAVQRAEETSREVDEYLEFLDRRYRRQRGRLSQSSIVSLPVFPWTSLNNQQQSNKNKPSSSSSNSPKNSFRKEENALYALGVAGMASERLLQKHSLRSENKNIVSTQQKQKQQPQESFRTIIINKLTPPKGLLQKTAKFVATKQQLVFTSVLGSAVGRQVLPLCLVALGLSWLMKAIGSW